MTCSTHNARLLSECLDGRLASRRREALLEHLASCARCSQTFDDMQRARDLVVRARTEHVGADFRDGLWARIDAGEGTPETALERPIPWAAKIRYITSGAAAAALMLVGLQLMVTWLADGAAPARTGAARDTERLAHSAPAGWGDETGTAVRGGAATAGAEDATPAGRPLRPFAFGSARGADRSADDDFELAARPLDPFNVVETVHDELRSNTRRLVGYAWDIERDLDRRRGAHSRADAVYPEFHRTVRETGATASTLRWMSERGIVELPQPMQEHVSRLIGAARRTGSRPEDPGVLREVAREVARIDPDALDQKVQVVCCGDRGEFADALTRYLVEQNPEGARFLRLTIVSREIDPFDVVPRPESAPGSGGTIVLRLDADGSGFLTRRRGR